MALEELLGPGFRKPEQGFPKDWRVVQLKEVARTCAGGRMGLTKENNYIASGYPAFSAAGKDGYVDRAEFVDQDAVILSAIGANCGRCFLAEGSWTTLANVQAIIPTSELDARYLYYRVNASEYFTRSGSAQPFIKPSSIGSSWILLPPVDTQRTIARILGTVDGLIERTEALIAKQQQIKKGLLHDLFTRGVDAQGRLRPSYSEAPELYHETALGWLPKGWRVEKLGNHIRSIGGHIQTGPFGSQLHAHEYTNEGVPVIMPQDINDAQINTAAIARIEEQRAVTLLRHRVQLNDVVLARRGELSRAACITLREVGWVCGTGCLLMRSPVERMNGHWLALVYGHSVTQRHVEARAIGSTMLNVSATLLAGLPMAFPDVAEQNEIAKRVDCVQSVINSNAEELDKLRLLKSGLMQDLLTGRVSVEELTTSQASVLNTQPQ